MPVRARDIMTGGVECVGEQETLEQAARKMKDLDVGSLPICGEDNRLKGMITDRDIVIKCLADGGDPRSVTAVELAEGKPVTIGADDEIDVAIMTMQEHQVRRLPVIDGHDLVHALTHRLPDTCSKATFADRSNLRFVSQPGISR